MELCLRSPREVWYAKGMSKFECFTKEGFSEPNTNCLEHAHTRHDRKTDNVDMDNLTLCRLGKRHWKANC